MTLAKMLEDCTQEEREAAMLLFKGAATAEESQAILTLVSMGRTRRARARYENDEDGGRTTMPARIPTGLAKTYQDCARRRGLSTYAWVREAMHNQFRRDTDPRAMARAARRRRKTNREAAKRLQQLLDDGRIEFR